MTENETRDLITESLWCSEEIHTVVDLDDTPGVMLTLKDGSRFRVIVQAVPDEL